MESQLSFGFGQAQPAERLFFALMPDSQAVEAIGRRVQELQRSERLSARPLLPQRLHVTLHHLGDFAGIPPSLLDSARQAAMQVEMPAFDVRFDQVGSFGGRPGNIRWCCVAIPGMRKCGRCKGELGLQLARRGLGHDDTFTPHLTLMYDPLQLAPRPLAPVCWRAHEFVLIRSFLGQTRYQFEGRWPLR